MRALIILLTLCVASTAGIAAEIRAGVAAQVKPNAIWFQDKAALARWQRLKHDGDAAALAALEDAALSRREAWRFTEPQRVIVRGHAAKQNSVEVEMTAEGRLQGTRWMVDAAALE